MQHAAILLWSFAAVEISQVATRTSSTQHWVTSAYLSYAMRLYCAIKKPSSASLLCCCIRRAIPTELHKLLDNADAAAAAAAVLARGAQQESILGSCEVLSPVRARKHTQQMLGASEQVRCQLSHVPGQCGLKTSAQINTSKRRTWACLPMTWRQIAITDQASHAEFIIDGCIHVHGLCRCAPLFGGVPGS